MTELETKQLKMYKSHLRLTADRELYTIPQAAFRLNCSRCDFWVRFVETGLVLVKLEGNKKMVAKAELKKAVDLLPSAIHKNAGRKMFGL